MKNGIVIPCFNEAQRLKLDKFEEFVRANNDYVLCFVNDGSTDQTLEVLERFQSRHKEKVLVCNLIRNSGKAEAVRSGVRYLAAQKSLGTVGFMDADLSTGFDEYQSLVEGMNGKHYMVFGSRKSGNEHTVERSWFRSLASNIVGTLIRLVLGLPIRDTQCGAKVFRTGLANRLFRNAFTSRWLFDVELFIRAKKLFGRKRVMNRLEEVPLKKWVAVDGSKITASDSIKIPLQLLKIWYTYTVTPSLNLIQQSTQRISMQFAQAFGIL